MKDEVFDNEPNVGSGDSECCVPEDDGNINGADNMSEEIAADSDNTSTVSDAVAEWKDKYLRLVAEFDNYRKRTLKEKMSLIDSGCEDVIKSLLGVMDDLDRAMDSVMTAKDMESVKEGMVLIYRKLIGVLEAKGVKEIDALCKDFDIDEQEAVAKVQAGEEMHGKVIDVVQKGYKLKDKVVRYAKVVVGE